MLGARLGAKSFVFWRSLSLSAVRIRSTYTELNTKNYSTSSQPRKPSMELREIVSKLEEMFPLRLAQDWDNVGLLVQPSDREHKVSHIMLTNDLTEEVVDEIEKCDTKVGLVIAYHPPIFKPLKRLTARTANERIIVRAVESKIAIYSPHTAVDCYYGGVNDWLAAGIGEGATRPIQPVNLLCEVKATSLKMADELKRSGIGRILTLATPVSLSDLVIKVRQFLGLTSLRLARGRNCKDDDVIKTIAIVAGSGGSVLHDVVADVYLTGEMSHHEVLKATSCGVSVILCEHSNTERGFLRLLQASLKEVLSSDIIISQSQADHDPLETVSQ